MISLTFETKNDRLQAIADKIDSGSSGLSPATLEIYSGVMPEGHGAQGPEDLVLITVEVPYPCAQSVTSGVLTLNQMEEAMAMHSGIATWCRVRNGSGEIVFDADVGNLESTAFLRMANTQVYEGIYLTLEETYIAE